MGERRWEWRLGAGLLGVSALMFALKLYLIGDEDVTYNYFLNSLGFLPISVLFVTLIVNRLLVLRTHQDKLEKINMVVGAFFSEVGIDLMRALIHTDPAAMWKRPDMAMDESWQREDFEVAKARVCTYPYGLRVEVFDLKTVSELLEEKREFLLRLWENPSILENVIFSEVLRTVFHVSDELRRRPSLDGLGEADMAHLTEDLRRAYRHLLREWLDYCSRLRERYPYQYSLAVRTNPFEERGVSVG